MPAKKQMYNKRRTYAKKKKYVSSNRPVNLNRRIKKIENMIELKYFDTYVPPTTIDDVGVLFPLNIVDNDVGGISRIGDEVYNTSIQFRGEILTDESVVGPTYIRMILFWDSQCNGALPTITDSPGGGNGLLDTLFITSLVQAPFAYYTQKRYRVLYDKRVCLNPLIVQTTTVADTTAVVPVGMQFHKKIKLGRKTKYNLGPAPTTIEAITTNSLIMLYVSDQSANLPSISTGFRLYFKDP